VAGYDTDPAYMGHIESMSFCQGNPLGLLDSGQIVLIRAIYNSPTAASDVMGIMLAYIHPRAIP
jgi:hypothetical protein